MKLEKEAARLIRAAVFVNQLVILEIFIIFLYRQ
jgi:hypothetical protein